MELMINRTFRKRLRFTKDESGLLLFYFITFYSPMLIVEYATHLGKLHAQIW